MKNVFITIRGGCIQEVVSDEPLNVVLMDYDEFEGNPPEEWDSDIRTQGLFIMDSEVIPPGKKFTDTWEPNDEEEETIHEALIKQGL